MRATAIICEYNPFTNGHLFHLESVKAQTAADTVIAVMSGSFVQRGESAIADKYQRASVAARLGCDMVVELPTVFAVSPADNFAYGAMKLIKAMPFITCVSFGSECGDIDKLTALSDLLINEPDEVKVMLNKFLDEGDSFPKARAKAVNEYVKEHEEFFELLGLIDEPNNILALSYISAARKLDMKVSFHTVKRVGGGYNEEDVNNNYPSATAIRAAAKQNKLNELADKLPAFSFNLLETCNFKDNSLGDLILFRLKEMSSTELANYYDVSGGLHNRIKIAADMANTYEQFLEEAKTKKYTLAKIKRISLYALLGITKDIYSLAVDAPAYISILALRKERKDILSELNASCENVLVRYSDIDRVDKSLRPLIKMDFTAQGVLSIINHSNYYNKKMVLI